jgi:hypothetical protein
VHHAAGPRHRIGQIMRVAQPAQHLDHDEDRERRRDRTRFEQAREVLAVDVLHDQEQPIVEIAAEVEHRDDVGMREPRHDARLRHEHGRECGHLRQPR